MYEIEKNVPMPTRRGYAKGMTTPDLDAWECRECCGQGSVTRLHKVTHQLGTDLMPFDDECEACEGLGYCGPDAAERAKATQ